MMTETRSATALALDNLSAVGTARPRSSTLIFVGIASAIVRHFGPLAERALAARAGAPGTGIVELRTTSSDDEANELIADGWIHLGTGIHRDCAPTHVLGRRARRAAEAVA